MQECAIAWFVTAWLGCWLIDLAIILARGSLAADPVLKFVVVLIALGFVLHALWRHGWLWNA